MMTTLTTGTRYPVVTLFLALWIALLALAAPASGVGATDLEDAYTGHRVLCQALGGTVDEAGTHENRTVGSGRTGAVVKCNGSIIGGYGCKLTGEHGTVSVCTQTRIAEGEDIHVAPVGGVEDVSEPDTSGPDRVGGIAVQPGSAEDPTGDAEDLIESQVPPADQAGACEALGGTATLIEQSTRPIDVRCTGGILDGMDGMICYGTICDYFTRATGPEGDPSVTPTGGMLIVPITPGEAPVGATGASVTPGVGEDPAGGDTVVIMNQTGPTVEETTKGQVAFCEFLGGTATPIDSGPGLSIVACKGGLLGGMTCFNSEDATNCMFGSSFVLPEEDPQVTPAAGIEVVPESPMETAPAVATEVPTVAPTPPAVSVTPTAIATEPSPMPTAVPTEAPVLPTIPTDDESVPPGEAEDPTDDQPAPTEAPLR